MQTANISVGDERIRVIYEQLDKLRSVCTFERVYGHEDMLEMCNECIETISDYNGHKIDIDKVFGRLKEIMQARYVKYGLNGEGTVASVLNKTHKILWKDDSNRAVTTLMEYLGRNVEFQRMGKNTHQYKKCAMTLSVNNANRDEIEGTVIWFTRRWHTLLEDDRRLFQAEISRTLELQGRMDFQVSVREGSDEVVLLYIDSGLRKLAAETFQPYEGENTNPFVQALNQLHNPHAEYRVFAAKAYDLEEDRWNPLMRSEFVQIQLGGLLAELRMEQLALCESLQRQAVRLSK
jgi:hypothetical protein